MDILVDFESFGENFAIVGLEVFLQRSNGKFLVGFHCLDAFDPSAHKSFHHVSAALQKWFADNDRAAGILDRQLTQIDYSVISKFLSLESCIPRENRAIYRAHLESAEAFRQPPVWISATSRSGVRLW